MKFQKISLVTAIMICIALMSYSPSRFITLTFNWTGSVFLMTDNSDPLDDPGNWSAGAAGSCTSTGKMCEVVASYSGSPSQSIGEQEIIDAVKAKYDLLAAQNPSSTFSDNYTWSVLYIYGVQVDFLVRLKS